MNAYVSVRDNRVAITPEENNMDTRTREEILDELKNADVDMPEELKLEVVDLADKLSELLKPYSQSARLFVLEAAMTQSLANMSPALGGMFQDMLQVFKEKVTLFITLSDVLSSAVEHDKDKDPVQ